MSLVVNNVQAIVSSVYWSCLTTIQIHNLNIYETIIVTDWQHDHQAYRKDFSALYSNDNWHTRSERRRADVSEQDHRNTVQNSKDAYRRRRWLVAAKLERRLWSSIRRRQEKRLLRRRISDVSKSWSDEGVKIKRMNGRTKEILMGSWDILRSTNKWKNQLLLFVQNMIKLVFSNQKTSEDKKIVEWETETILLTC